MSDITEEELSAMFNLDEKDFNNLINNYFKNIGLIEKIIVILLAIIYLFVWHSERIERYIGSKIWESRYDRKMNK